MISLPAAMSFVPLRLRGSTIQRFNGSTVQRFEGSTIQLSSLRLSSALALLAFALCAAPSSLFACSVCYGQSDSPMAYGFNAGIISLLAVVVAVLGSIAGFFFYLAKRARLNGSTIQPFHDSTSPPPTTNS